MIRIYRSSVIAELGRHYCDHCGTLIYEWRVSPSLQSYCHYFTEGSEIRVTANEGGKQIGEYEFCNEQCFAAWHSPVSATPPT